MNLFSPFNECTDFYQSIRRRMDDGIGRIYDFFKYFFFDANNTKLNEEEFESKIANVLKKFKLIVFKISNENIHAKNYNQISFQKKVFVICTETQCFIINNIEEKSITKIINQIKNTYINLGNISTIEKEKDILNIKEEVNAAKIYFLSNKKINDNFVENTFDPIITFLIRRFFYPKYFFKERSFFSYSNQNKEQNHEDIKKYYSKDIIKLRKLDFNSKSIIYLAMDVKEFYVFVLKQYYDQDDLEKDINYTKKQISHDCILKCFGVFVEKDVNVGVIYQFMCNGSLDKYIKRNPNIFFSLTTLLRIWKGIKFIHSKCILHRDLKPTNILLDNNFLCYISDFDTIKILDNENEKALTKDFASELYASPELQENSKFEVSYPADIYSFGQIIYFIFEKSDMMANHSIEFLKKCKILKMTNTPPEIQNLCKGCIHYNPNERLTNDMINKIFSKKIKILEYIGEYFVKKSNIFPKSDLITLLYEYMTFIITNCDLNDIQFNINVAKFGQTLSQQILNDNYSNFYYELANMYEKNDIFQQNYINAKELYKLSIQNNNINSYCRLGILYYNGLGVEKPDFIKARMYFERSLTPEAKYYLGLINLKGQGVAQNRSSAEQFFTESGKEGYSQGWVQLGDIYYNEHNIQQCIKYYENAVQQNDSYGYKKLGDLYFSEKNYQKAKEYYEQIKNEDDSAILQKLGYIHLYTDNNVSEAKKCFEKAENNNNNILALLGLGEIYYEEKYGQQDYNKAKHYYELAAQKHYNSFALCKLGNIYSKGKLGKINYEKSIKYYKKAAKLGYENGYYSLATIYYQKNDNQVNIDKIIKYLEKTLEINANHIDSLNLLGYIYLNERISSENHEKAKRYFSKSLSNDPTNQDKYALCNYGDYYYYAQYESKDIPKATQYYIQSSEKGYSDGTLKLGIIQKNHFHKYSLAKTYFEKAAQENNIDSYYYLGKTYYKGYGTSIDYPKSIHYYEIASFFSHPKAQYCLGIMYYYGIGTKKSYKDAFYLFNLAEKTNLNAAYYLGHMFENGKGVERNISKAIMYYEKCAKKEETRFVLTIGDGFKRIKIHNKYYYQSKINLCLIYLTEKDKINIELAEKYLREANFSQHPFAHYLYGIYYQYYLHQSENAIEKLNMLTKIENKFYLAEFVLANLSEQDSDKFNKYRESMKYENNIMRYKKQLMDDERLEISQLYINCYEYLQLIKYNLYENKIGNENNEFCLTIIFRLIFKLLFYDNIQSYEFAFSKQFKLKEFILNYPLFSNLNSPTNPWKQIKTKDKSDIKYLIIRDQNESNCINEDYDIFWLKKNYSRCNDEIDTYIWSNEMLENIFNSMNNDKFNSLTIQEEDANNLICIFFSSKGNNIDQIIRLPKKILDDVSKCIDYLEISEIVTEMEKQIYSNNYEILLGRINIQIQTDKAEIPEINDLFYEGIGFKLD